MTIRALASQADLDACVAMQRDTWGPRFGDVVPASILQVSQRIGGVAAGAFDEAGRLVGFVFGMTGVENGEVVHWSDMLAVRPEARDRGVGRRLKEYQRRAVARLGGHTIYWTYDPLVARNAHLNFNVFGVRAVEYVADMYGRETGSDLHQGIGTDRLIVAWPVDNADVDARRRETLAARRSPDFDGAPVVGDPGRAERAGADAIGRAPRLRIAIPRDIVALIGTDATGANAWRGATRRAFTAALAAEYRVEGFRMDAGDTQGSYLLSRS